MDLPLDTLRRWPDVEAGDLRASDAADRLVLDESATARATVSADEIAVIGDTHGALTLSVAAAFDDRAASGLGIRVHQDDLVGEQALAANAERVGLGLTYRSLPLTAETVQDARVVLMRLPRSLDALRDVAGLIAAHAAPDVAVYAGGRIKHMTVAMNDVLRESFAALDVTHARQKSRVLLARAPREGREPVARQAAVDGIVVCAYGGVFAGATIDIGTRMLLAQLPAVIPGSADDVAIDLGCGTGVVGAALAVRHPDLRVYACDRSAAAVASARETAAANGVADRLSVNRDDGLASREDGSASFIALNPPFHSGAAVHEGLAPRLFAEAARVLRPGGELWTVWNSHLRYRPALERVVGPTRQIARNAKFTVTASIRR
ncbi:methyltransferase [Microbacterium sp. LRZ72]|uniref:class I SAM-dependent methyltransferase n=1 Tax=Microbacterium sp. LRZ72 TaxID=2942481 RepID=UPI0029B8CF08|nr:methyltransferase [Microbacterium sp. LRZ72]MDX2375885.1 methyltransferase [Microbacterium sp. LRZ72]